MIWAAVSVLAFIFAVVVAARRGQAAHDRIWAEHDAAERRLAERDAVLDAVFPPRRAEGRDVP